MQALRPGTSPPPVRMPIRISSARRGQEAGPELRCSVFAPARHVDLGAVEGRALPRAELAGRRRDRPAIDERPWASRSSARIWGTRCDLVGQVGDPARSRSAARCRSPSSGAGRVHLDLERAEPSRRRGRAERWASRTSRSRRPRDSINAAATIDSIVHIRAGLRRGRNGGSWAKASKSVLGGGGPSARVRGRRHVASMAFAGAARGQRRRLARRRGRRAAGAGGGRRRGPAPPVRRRRRLEPAVLAGGAADLAADAPIALSGTT